MNGVRGPWPPGALRLGLGGVARGEHRLRRRRSTVSGRTSSRSLRGTSRGGRCGRAVRNARSLGVSDSPCPTPPKAALNDTSANGRRRECRGVRNVRARCPAGRAAWSTGRRLRGRASAPRQRAVGLPTSPSSPTMAGPPDPRYGRFAAADGPKRPPRCRFSGNRRVARPSRKSIGRWLLSPPASVNRPDQRPSSWEIQAGSTRMYGRSELHRTGKIVFKGVKRSFGVCSVSAP